MLSVAAFFTLHASLFTSCSDDRPDFQQRPVVTPPAPTTAFASGADISSITEFKNKGVKFYQNAADAEAGTETEVTQIMKNLGMNAVRHRVWVNPKADMFCDKADVVAKCKVARDLGMRIMIDFHYSDTWADPGTQTVPKAWKNDNIDQLIEHMAAHTKDVLQALKNENISVEWVQVGNETTDGMMWPLGKSSTHMENYARLTDAGYGAVKSIYPDAQVIVHIDKAVQFDRFNGMFRRLKLFGARWDIIGMSFYPDDPKNETDQVVENIINLAERYGTPCMIVETGLKSKPASGTPGTPEYKAAQKEMALNNKEAMTYLFNRMMNDTKGYCRGILWWSPESYSGTSYDKGAFYDEGYPTEALDPFDMAQYK